MQTIIVEPKYAYDPSERFVCDIDGDGNAWSLTITLSAPDCNWNDGFRHRKVLHEGQYTSKFSALRKIIDWRDNAC